MKRFFGGKKEAPPPPPSLNEATETVNKRVGVLDDKIKLLDKQLVDYKNQIKNARPGSVRRGARALTHARGSVQGPGLR